LRRVDSGSGTGRAVAAGWGSTSGTTSSRPIQIYEINLRSARRGGRVVGQNPTSRPATVSSRSYNVQAVSGLAGDRVGVADVIGQNAAVSSRAGTPVVST
jgi:hypothetical protein